MGFWHEWQQRRRYRREASAFAKDLFREPGEEAVRWLAAEGTSGDVDHARWELRYARRAMGLLVARRDALDDQTVSAVAAALAKLFETDRNIAPDRRAMAERQFNVRLSAYREALEERVGAPLHDRLGQALLGFCGKPARYGADATVRAGVLLERFMEEAHDALRSRFGEAELPEDLPPSAVAAGRRA